ncbi:MAG: phosphotransferase [Streptosporangiales bacterium]|nr:phosphotransferase [Streptosporangiales bacterium]
MAESSFSSESVQPVLKEACRRAGFLSGSAEPVRLGENALFRLSDASVIVRITRPGRLHKVEKELCVARWLESTGVPAIRLVPDIEQPLVVDGFSVSFWREVAGGGPEPTRIDLARLLRAYHSLGDAPCDLPAFDPFGTSMERLHMASGVRSDDVRFLRELCVSLDEELRTLEFALPVGPIHGDAWPGNLLTDHGQVVLLDFEAAAVGPREWDLLPTAIATDRYGLHEQRYLEFAEAYGFDVREWPGYPVLREVREVTMATWIMQNANEGPAFAAEFELRVASLRDGDLTRVWNLF